jgi:uncharacterized protein YbbK (DUF523 family)
LGEKVRFDGGHKLDRFISDTLGKFFEWVSVCPEVEAGFGTPREPIRLVQIEGSVGLWTVNSGQDLTAWMRTFAASRSDALEQTYLNPYPKELALRNHV